MKINIGLSSILNMKAIFVHYVFTQWISSLRVSSQDPQDITT